ncbi:anthranilate synthase component I family protein [Streptomyces hawaiiensis]|uniref:anthranilate synthase component I family protein n=1 Tax=Streptomyces hawaiiensis TaxID=67305 RepID=UPI00366A413D
MTVYAPTEETPVVSALRRGSTVHRCERLLPGPVDPAGAAAALRGNGRMLLATSGGDSGRTPLLAVGELALVSSGPTRDRLPGARESALHAAVRLLDGLDFADARLPEERRWFGVIGYDAVRDIERLKPRPDERLPVYDFFVPEILVRFEEAGVRIVGRGCDASAAARACARATRLLATAVPHRPRTPRTGPGTYTMSRAEYFAAVARAKRYILDGDIFQVVLSLGVTAMSDADGLSLFSALSSFNPSPYQFWYRSREFEVVGCSPEPCVTLVDGRATIRPLAGTRPRGADRAADLRAERELRASEKELAEHRMLVDLARNDLGRVCAPGTVVVPHLMRVERYSHVMHLTSDVAGELGPHHAGTADLLAATFPAGTMTGAPKVRAMEIIDELEPVGRSFYSGAVGSFGPDAVDLWLTIRSAVLHDGMVRIQAGGGIVHDSDPAQEYDECLAKLGAAARAARLDLGPAQGRAIA